MRILFVCHRFPFPPQRGGKIRPFNMIRHLHSRGHQVVVASMARTQQEAAAGAGLAERCEEALCEVIGDVPAWARMVLRLPTPVPSSFGYFHSPRLAARIRERLARGDIDFILVHCSSAAQYVEDVTGIPKLLDFGDMDSQKWREYAHYKVFPLSAGYWWEGMRLEATEKKLARKFDLCTATTRAELETLDGFQTGVASDWYPNGVDANYFSPAGDEWDANTICFVGRMDYYPNQQGVTWFCREVLPMLKRELPQLRFKVVGADPSAQIRALAADPAVEVTGSVPDVRPYLRSSALTIAPLQIARGTQNKILESMALGVPVISSRIAAGGVDAVAGEHLLVADSPEEYRSAIVGLLRDPQRRRALAQAGRARVLSNHSWDSSMRRLEAIIERCAAGFAARHARGGPSSRP